MYFREPHWLLMGLSDISRVTWQVWYMCHPQVSVHFLCRYLLNSLISGKGCLSHDDVIKWKHFPRYWPFERGIHRSPVNSPHKGQWRGALMFSFIFDWINGWVNNREAGDLRRHRAHYDSIVMESQSPCTLPVLLCNSTVQLRPVT